MKKLLIEYRYTLLLICALVLLRTLETNRAVPHYGSLYYALAQNQQKQNNIKKAKKFYDTSLKHNPSYAFSHFQLGNLFKKEGNKDLYLKHYQSIVDLKAQEYEFAEVYHTIGKIYLNQGLLDQAILHFRTSLKQDKAYFDSYYSLALAYFKKDQQKDVEQTYLSMRRLVHTDEAQKLLNKIKVLMEKSS